MFALVRLNLTSGNLQISLGAAARTDVWVRDKVPDHLPKKRDAQTIVSITGGPCGVDRRVAGQW